MEDVIVYFVSLFLCYALSRLLFFILWKKYKGDDELLERKTDDCISNYKELMIICRYIVVVGVVPIVNTFISMILLGVNIIVLLWWLSHRFVNVNWIPKDKR